MYAKQNFYGDHLELHMRVGNTEIIVKHAEIAKEEVDAIVTATTTNLTVGGKVDAAIHKAAGPAIAAELKQISAQIKKLPPGESVITAAGKLKAKYVVHTVGPVWCGGKKAEAETLENAYFNSCMMAKEYGAKSVALPAISVSDNPVGEFTPGDDSGYPVEQAAEIAIRTIKEFCEQYSDFEEVRFVLHGDWVFTAFDAQNKKAE